jgi:hypothetical protein
VTTLNNVYLQPSLTLELSLGMPFFALSGDVLVLPGVSYSDAPSTTWVSYGLQGDIGMRF